MTENSYSWVSALTHATRDFAIPASLDVAVEQSVNPSLLTSLKPPIRAAAVLIAITDEPEPWLVLTKRAEHLKHHPGQISFAGGGVEEADACFTDTALREAWEEIALPRDQAEVIGCMRPALTISNYCMVPVIAKVAPDINYVIDPAEVDCMVKVPYKLAVDLESYESVVRHWGNQPFTMHSFTYDGHLVWGATASVLHRLATLLSPEL